MMLRHSMRSISFSSLCRLFVFIFLAMTLVLMQGSVSAKPSASQPMVSDQQHQNTNDLGLLPSSLPLRRESTDSTAVLLIKIVSLLLLFAVATYLFLRLLKQRNEGVLAFDWLFREGAPPHKVDSEILQSKKRLVLNSKVTLHTVQWQDQLLLLACTDQGVSVLASELASDNGDIVDELNTDAHRVADAVPQSIDGVAK